MLQIAICDDENGDISIVQILISDCLLNSGIEYELSTFRTARSFLLSVNKESYSPDILILDIVLDSASGIDIAKDLNHLLPHCQIIFISNYDDYVSEVYAVNHCYFIRKKEVTKHFRHALQKSINNLSLKQFISLRTEGEFRRLEVDSILYMERDLRRTHIHCIDKEFTCYTKPDAIISGLNSSPFLRCHQSFWVNLGHVSVLRGSSFILDNGAIIPISRSQKQEAKNRWFSFLHQQAFQGKQQGG